MADHFAEFSLPDTDLTRKAYDLVFSEGTEAIANHSARTYLFARAIGERRGLRPAADYDDEVLFLASVLHDIGLTERGDGAQRFEVDGADRAAEFLSGHGLDDERVRVAWEAIALHSSLGIAHRMRPEIALTHAGTSADITGLGAGTLPEGLADRAHGAFPRAGGGPAITAAIIDQIARNPAKAPIGSLPGEIARQHGAGAPVPEWRELVAAAWPGVG
ncbi:HD domain-containing protein [Actinomadura sp. 7K507]|uniref:HD domain-containing protein n=1 Tax=Actinomadura sp. 7K507 TaxID=2530365 RepID=UPI0010480897|nr:HD domain-containing protein [Actinomadura sp. 7K507]TDC82902.1 HD domain-containing protein [Actinomadura sp. 7K507]